MIPDIMDTHGIIRGPTVEAVSSCITCLETLLACGAETIFGGAASAVLECRKDLEELTPDDRSHRTFPV
jgi:hypothetical protein